MGRFAEAVDAIQTLTHLQSKLIAQDSEIKTQAEAVQELGNVVRALVADLRWAVKGLERLDAEVRELRRYVVPVRRILVEPPDDE